MILNNSSLQLSAATNRSNRLSHRIFSEFKRNAFIYVFLIPILIHFVVFQLFPLAFSFVLTFMDWPLIGTPKFIGLDNWQYFLTDKLAWKSIWNTFMFSVYYIIPTMALGLGLALLVNSGVKGAGFFKGLYFLPVVTSFVIISGIWSWMFKGTEYGVINYFLSFFGVDTQLFFSNSKQALPLMAGLSIFKVCGNTMVYYYAGLRSIPSHLYEAAKIDGASTWTTFWKVTFPLLLPIHFYVGIMTTIGAFQVFDSAFLITNGGPNYATSTIVYYLYEQGFTGLRFGYASVLAYALFFIILVISLIQKKYLNKEVTY
ncbi:carbohydrate ABC transporter permease [Paenibacillus marinisediminis]